MGKSLFIDSLTLRQSSLPEKVSKKTLEARIGRIDDEIDKLSVRLKELYQERAGVSRMLAEYDAESGLPPLRMENPTITKGASPEEKASFLLSLFSPRTDIYASRIVKRMGDLRKVIYYPKCINHHKPGCIKAFSDSISRNVCASCELQKYSPLTSSIIIDGNFRNTDEYGNNAVGIYPLKEGNLTRFVAIDLDDGSWEKDARYIISLARSEGFSMVWEKSSSGNGAHIWLFFSEDIDARIARRLAFAFLDRAREDGRNISIKSYDRLFPSQDTLTKKGVGNLILLPLVNGLSHKGCTVFLDDHGTPYPLDYQLEYLSSIHKHSKAEVEAYLKSRESNSVRFSFSAGEDINPTWLNRIPKLTKDDVSGTVILYLSCGVTIDKNILSAKALESFRRLATIANPQYYALLQSRDGKIWNVKSRIPLYEENERVIMLPRGLLDKVIFVLDISEIPYEIEDHRVQNTGLKATFTGKLYPPQDLALKKLLEHDTGILASGTGFGKTFVALALIATLAERTLIIVSNANLVEQWEAKINEALEIESIGSEGRCYGVYDGRKKKLSGVVDIVMLQSLASAVQRGSFDKFLGYGLVIVDECHHIAAEKSRLVLNHLNAKYVYGLSATIKRSDGLERIVYAECGEISFSYGSSKIARDIGIMQNYSVRFLDTVLPYKEYKNAFNDILNAISADERRSLIIAEDIAREYRAGKKILVFTRRLEKNHKIGQALDKLEVQYSVLDGEVDRKRFDEILSFVRTTTDPYVLIATDKLLGEGIDIPTLNTLFLASPFKQPAMLQQCAGRLLRAYEGKSSTLIYDYVDYRIPLLGNMFSARIPIYRKLGFLPLAKTSFPHERGLHNGETFFDSLEKDFLSARKEIVVSITYALPSTISMQILESLSAAKSRGTLVTIRGSLKNVSQAMASRFLSEIEKRELDFTKVNRCVGSIIIDGRICWYGELNPFAISAKTMDNAKNQYILRIVDEDAVKHLYEDDESLFSV